MGRPNNNPEEFRREAVELYRSSDRPRAVAARSLRISDDSLAAWVKRVGRDEQRRQYEALFVSVGASRLIVIDEAVGMAMDG